MNPANIYIPTHVHFGEGRIVTDLPELIAKYCAERVLLVSDAGLVKVGVIQRILDLLKSTGKHVTVFSEVEPDPSVETVHRVASVFEEVKADTMLAVGGGSSIDVAKGARVIVTQGGHIRDYSGLQAQRIEDTGRVPLIAVPTTSGTGSEVTFFGVYSDWKNNLKITVTSSYMAPTVALVDSSLTHSVPSSVTASTGIDVLAHAVETYVSRAAVPFSDALALRAIELVSRSLKTAVFYGNDRIARDQMSEASLLAGIAFNHSYLGLTHAIAAGVSGHAHVPHGVAIGLLLSHVMHFNLPANEQKFSRITQIISGQKMNSPDQAHLLVQQLAQDIGIPQRLSGVGVTEEMLSGIAAQTMRSVQLRFNPMPVTEELILQLIKKIY